MSVKEFTRLLTQVDVSEDSPIVDKLIEKCQLTLELSYGCYVTVYVRGKKDCLTPLQFLEQTDQLHNRRREEEEFTEAQKSKIREELLHVMFFVLQIEHLKENKEIESNPQVSKQPLLLVLIFLWGRDCFGSSK